MLPQVITFGCRFNAYESEQIQHALEAAGVSDIIVVNTCAVTAEAERQARQLIRKKHKANQSVRIVVMGCAAVVNKQAYSSLQQVFAVVSSVKELLQ
ncbi:MAG: tRNA (N(6)-L-threonylcarbamoyladenosine(37)-C(2))-methylthiotransferase MtaB, partial [Holosporales bacterium]|nr:tRNA (N(6)-L-threonylcarbamoyladenosine(37)-C(2))-methylthiotransferase MtaB [Holosporales bacterium]